MIETFWNFGDIFILQIRRAVRCQFFGNTILKFFIQEKLFFCKKRFEQGLKAVIIRTPDFVYFRRFWAIYNQKIGFCPISRKLSTIFVYIWIFLNLELFMFGTFFRNQCFGTFFWNFCSPINKFIYFGLFSSFPEKRSEISNFRP